MKKLLLTAAGALALASFAQAQLTITGILDGPRTGGLPKAIEIYVSEDVADLSLWSVQNYNNGDLTVTNTLALTGSATAGTFLYAASESPGFTAYFGFSPNFFGSALNVNGDDTVVLTLNTVIVDVFGVIGTDGTGQPWEYLDGFAYRTSGNLASPTFALSDWTFSGIDALDSIGTTGTNPADGAARFPVGSFAPVPEPHEVAFAVAGLLGLVIVMRRRRAQVA